MIPYQFFIIMGNRQYLLNHLLIVKSEKAQFTLVNEHFSDERNEKSSMIPLKSILLSWEFDKTFKINYDLVKLAFY